MNVLVPKEKLTTLMSYIDRAPRNTDSMVKMAAKDLFSSSVDNDMKDFLWSVLDSPAHLQNILILNKIGEL